MFPFMVLSAFVVKSGLSRRMSGILGVLTKTLFGLPGCTGATILIGLIGGYPAGARGIKALWERGEISQNHAERMLYFVVGAGPAFVISVVGLGLLRNYQIGLILFISQLISSIFIGMLLKFDKKDHENQIYAVTLKKSSNKNSLSDALVESCADSTGAMLSMCSLVVLFCSLWGVIKNTVFESMAVDFFTNIRLSDGISKSIFPVLLEVTIGCRDCVSFGASYTLLAFALGWAGICVHFQIYTSVGDMKFSKIKFISIRLLHGILAALIFSIFLKIYPATVAVSSLNCINCDRLPINAYSFTSGSLALILLCACFLSTLTPKIINLKESDSKMRKISEPKT
jgi:sporulation integral membrane protein YlbJ